MFMYRFIFISIVYAFRDCVVYRYDARDTPEVRLARKHKEIDDDVVLYSGTREEFWWLKAIFDVGNCTWYNFLDVSTYYHQLSFHKHYRTSQSNASIVFADWALLSSDAYDDLIQCVDITCMRKKLKISNYIPDDIISNFKEDGLRSLHRNNVLVKGLKSIRDLENVNDFFDSKTRRLCTFPLVTDTASATTAQAAYKTWAQWSFVHFIPVMFKHTDSTIEMLDLLEGLPGEKDVFENHIDIFEAIRRVVVEHHCLFSMIIPSDIYVNVPAVEQRLGCLSERDEAVKDYSFLGGLLSGNSDKYQKRFWFAGVVFSVVFSFSLVLSLPSIVKRDDCGREPPDEFDISYSFWLTECLGEYVKPQQYFDKEYQSLIDMRGQKDVVMSKFDSMETDIAPRPCLFLVGPLDAGDYYSVHKRVREQHIRMHDSYFCAKHQLFRPYLTNSFGQSIRYYSNVVLDRIVTCPDKKTNLYLEEAQKRIGNHSHKPPIIERRTPAKRNLCVFVPMSYNIPGHQELVEAVTQTWGDENTFFVNPPSVPIPKHLEKYTLTLPGDMDAPYAKLSLRIHAIFHAIGDSPVLRDMCNWYLKADLDSYLALRNIQNRLQCYDPEEDYYLGVLTAGGGKKEIGEGLGTVFNFGGSGYIVSRGLLPKVAHWSMFCFETVLHHDGGRALDDNYFALCLDWYGEVKPSQYLHHDEHILVPWDFENSKVLRHHEFNMERYGCLMAIHPLKKPEMMYQAHESLQKSLAINDCTSPPWMIDRDRLLNAVASAAGEAVYFNLIIYFFIQI